MTLQELRYIVALADTGHFGKASEACYISQSTLSTQIKKLEDFLGVALFDRSLKHVSLTPVGRKIVCSARTMLVRPTASASWCSRPATPWSAQCNWT